eukprot:1360638-Pyramimonas_sp.AAC.1
MSPQAPAGAAPSPRRLLPGRPPRPCRRVLGLRAVVKPVLTTPPLENSIVEPDFSWSILRHGH